MRFQDVLVFGAGGVFTIIVYDLAHVPPSTIGVLAMYAVGALCVGWTRLRRKY